MKLESIKRVVNKANSETSWYLIYEGRVQQAVSYDEFCLAAKGTSNDSFKRKETRTLIINTWDVV